jgi:hypothetical protein
LRESVTEEREASDQVVPVGEGFDVRNNNSDTTNNTAKAKDNSNDEEGTQNRTKEKRRTPKRKRKKRNKQQQQKSEGEERSFFCFINTPSQSANDDGSSKPLSCQCGVRNEKQQPNNEKKHH